MELRLRHPPQPEYAANFAEDIVGIALDVSKVTLDFSPESLADVDSIIQRFMDDKLTVRQMAETLFSFGCYVGEVFVRHHAGRWVNTDDTAMKGAANWPMVVQMANGRVVNPIGKVFKRFENGAEDNLPYFYQVFTRD